MSGSTERPFRSPLSRRQFLAASGAAGAFLLAAPSRALAEASTSLTARLVAQPNPTDIVAGRATIDLAGRQVETTAFNGMVPGPLLRARAGDTVRVSAENELFEPTSIHWHGIALANSMDGVPGVTQPPITTGSTFVYEFVTPDPGTYFFHPHVGLQLDAGLYAPLIVDDPSDPGVYDAEWVIVLDDWTDGVGRSPKKIFTQLRKGMGTGSQMPMGDNGSMSMDHGSMDMGSMDTGSMMMSDALGGMAGDVRYPLYLANGRPPKDPETFTARPGQRIRMRIINAGSDTAFRFAVGGQRLTVTHADGFPIQPQETDAVLLGMGERIDAIVTADDGATPVVAAAEGKDAKTRAVLRTGRGSITRWSIPELSKQLLTVDDLTPASPATLEPRTPDRTHRLTLGGNDMTYKWTINGKTYDPDFALPAAAGERVRLQLVNTSTMWHPIHLHGHTFAVSTKGTPGVRKDTVIVKPAQTVSVDFDARPGTWMLHCHNTYHLEAGMMTSIKVE